MLEAVGEDAAGGDEFVAGVGLEATTTTGVVCVWPAVPVPVGSSVVVDVGGDVAHPSVVPTPAVAVSAVLVVQSPVVGDVGSPAAVVVPSPVVDGSPEGSDGEDDGSPVAEEGSFDVVSPVSVDVPVGSVAVGSELEPVVGSAVVVEVGSVVVAGRVGR